ncbi:MAG TPA: ATP-dependent helicase [Kofleriaceae bacterium]|nr:ATP-dependent helicase [Kofleriaceae bacterium]
MSAGMLDGLNPEQREAAEYDGAAPLLVIAGAGSGKTSTLAHRVASLIARGVDPRRILLLTFTRRAAAEMSRRAHGILGRARVGGAELGWSGTFHAVANRLLRMHAEAIGLDPAFTVLDRSDSADLIDLVRNQLGLAGKTKRFPRKATCLAIYSRAVNTQEPLDEVLGGAFPWCVEWSSELRGLFAAYVDAKQSRHVLDYDDLLLYWFHLMQEPALARRVGAVFDHVLVDEYQDTNALQDCILRALKPDGRGLTVVGDDAQAIYSFRAASVENILRFPERFELPARVVALERNYRSTQPVLAAANAVIALAPRRFAKQLHSSSPSHEKPRLVTTRDETTQVDYVVERVLAEREAGLELKRQAVLFRAAHHSDALEVELGRRNIPFVKYGGLKFMEAAHVKDMLCVLRWVENPRDAVAGFRVLQLLPGVGPAVAQRAIDHVDAAGLAALGEFAPPGAAAADWPALCHLLGRLRDAACDWRGQVGAVRSWYQPHLERLYDSAGVRAGDLEQLEQIAGHYATRERFLVDLTLDPPEGTGDEAGPPHLDEDWLVLSTIHSAKGQEWDAVYVLNAADGCIPSDMAAGSPEQIEEERRLLYVAMTRARRSLHIIHPQRFFIRQQQRFGDRHVYTPLTRFIPESIRDRFEPVGHGAAAELDARAMPAARVDVGARLRDMWR